MMEELKSILAHFRHENAFLKAELSLTNNKYKREALEIEHFNNLKVADLEEIIKNLEEKYKLNGGQFEKDQKKLQQLNLQLNQKLKLYEEQINAASIAYDKMYNQNKNHLAQLESLLKQKEEELLTLKKSNLQLTEKVTSLDADIEREKSLSNELTIALSSERHQLKIITSRIEEIEQQFKAQLNASKGEIDKYKIQIRSLEEKSQRNLEEMKESLAKEKTSHQLEIEKAAQTEEETKRKFSELRMSHLSETQELIKENTKLLKKCELLQQSQAKYGSLKTQVNEVEAASNEVEQDSKEFSSFEKKLFLQAKTEECDELKEELAKDKRVMQTLHKEVQEVVTQLKTLRKENLELVNLNQCLNESLTEKEKALKVLVRETQEERSLHHQNVAIEKLKSEEHLAEMQGRITALENQLIKKYQDHRKESLRLKEKLKQYGNLIKKLRLRFETAVYKQKELEIQNETLRQDFVPSFRYRELQHSFQKMASKHTEFKAFIQEFSKKQENAPGLEDLRCGMTSITDQLLELESAQNEAYSVLSAL